MFQAVVLILGGIRDGRICDGFNTDSRITVRQPPNNHQHILHKPIETSAFLMQQAKIEIGRNNTIPLIEQRSKNI